MIKKSDVTQKLLESEKKYSSYGDTVHYLEDPVIFTDCEGSFMYDENNTPFLDLQMWYSAVNLGYKNKAINDAVHKQIDTLPQIASQYLHQTKIELSETIAKDIENKFNQKGRVHYNVGGAQSVEDSLKLVRNFTKGKSLMFAFEGGYHGRTLGATSITSSYRYRRRYGHFGDRAQFIPFPYCFRCPYKKKIDDCGFYCLSQFERLFETEYYGVWDPKVNEAEYAAFYVELIQGTGGYVVPPKGYFKQLQKILKQYNILMVDDEIQMGFYRTGKLWAAEHFEIQPDVIVFGKALTNGLNPLAGIWAKEEMINPAIFPPGSTHSTFNSNPLGTAAGLATLREFAKKDYETILKEKGTYFLDRLKDLKKKYKEIGDVNGLGMALRLEICEKDGFTPNKALLDKIANEGMKGDLQSGNKKYGLILDVGGYYKNVITFAPSLEISYEEIDLSIELLDQLFTRCID
ncbi:aspartate aminotransferase family protein [Rickettsiales bacterium LUAb2]